MCRFLHHVKLQIDEYLAAQGQVVKRVQLDQQAVEGGPGQQQQDQLTTEDLLGWSKVGAL